jgi:hypothetical protein
MAEAVIRFNLIDQICFVFSPHSLVLYVIQAFVPDRSIEKGFQGRKVIKILALFPKRDKSFLNHIFHHRRIRHILISKGRQGMKIGIKDLPKGLSFPTLDMLYDIFMHPVKPKSTFRANNNK